MISWQAGRAAAAHSTPPGPGDPPHFESKSESAVTNAQGTSITIDRPIDTIAGDLLIAAVIHSPNGIILPPIPSGETVSPWTEINHGKCTEISGVPTCSLGVWWLVAGPSEPVEYTFTQEGAHGANKTTGGILRYSGAHPTAPIGNTKANNAITPDTEPIALGITTTVANVTVLSISGVVDGEYAGITNSESTLFIIEARGSRPGLAASDAAYPSAETSTGDVSFENADEELWRTLTVEIKPDGPGPHTLTVAVGNDPGGDGSIGGGGTFAHGTSVEAATTSGTHSTFSSWQEGSPCGTVFDITSDQTCTADFVDTHT